MRVFSVRKGEKTSCFIRSSESTNDIYKTFHDSPSSIFHSLLLKIETQCLFLFDNEDINAEDEKTPLLLFCFPRLRNPHTKVPWRKVLHSINVSKDEKSEQNSLDPVSRQRWIDFILRTL